jgi:protoporphyrinogen oxidase
MKIMESYKYIILGAGPSGLSFASMLKEQGENSLLVIEKEAAAGGLCRSEFVDGAPIDIGGGHFLDVKRKEVLDFLFQFMPESEWRKYERISKINIRGGSVDYPLESNLWQLPIADQIDFLEAIARAGCVRGLPMPESFERWISWKLGSLIADEYMLPYNRKIWSIDLNDLGTYWLYKLPDVSFRETLQSCLERRPSGSIPAHGTFLYPKHHGYGEVWKRMGQALGDHLRLGCPVTSIDTDRLIVNGMIKADVIVNTIPWVSWFEIDALPQLLHNAVRDLRYASVDIDYHSGHVDSPAHWIYEPSYDVPHHRLLLRHNFVGGAGGYWTETNSRRSGIASGFRHSNTFAYPVNTVRKLAALDKILKWARSRNILPLGRWGLWEHMNSDVAVESAIEAARLVAHKGGVRG